jgi:hypothetical protein
MISLSRSGPHPVALSAPADALGASLSQAAAIDARTGRPVEGFGISGALDALEGIRRDVPRGEYQLMC